MVASRNWSPAASVCRPISRTSPSTAATGPSGVEDYLKQTPDGLAEARGHVEAVIAELEKGGLDRSKLVIGGFSQGAMLTCDAVLHTGYPFAGLVQLSGNLLAQAVWSPLMPKRRGLPVFQSYGTQDEILPHIGAGEGEMLVCGLSLGWADTADKVNTFVTPRVPAEEFTHWLD